MLSKHTLLPHLLITITLVISPYSSAGDPPKSTSSSTNGKKTTTTTTITTTTAKKADKNKYHRKNYADILNAFTNPTSV